MESKLLLVDTFLNSIYVYDYKVLILLNYKNGEICVTFDDIKAVVDKKENSGNRSDCQSSPFEVAGDPPGIRTPDTLIKSQVLCRLS